jgi:hypothetical protein
MTFKEFLKSLESTKTMSSGEDLADSIALIVLMALVCLVIFI